MKLILYNNTSPPNYLNKTIQQVEEVDGTIREATSIIDPNIVLERSSPMGFNYAYIPEFKRYYFVTGISSVTNGLVGVQFHVDVLMTYKEQVVNFDAIVARQENQYNLYLDDGTFKVFQNTKHKVVAFPNKFDQFSNVLAIAGGGT